MRFEKVSSEQYKDAVMNIICTNLGITSVNELRSLAEEIVESEYENIKLPRRATIGSAGYDFFSPISFTLKAGETIKFPTGIRALLDDDKVLIMLPRSGLGFKYRLQLDNTAGVIDSDYANSDNEGHIFIKITNDSKEGKTLEIEAGEAIAQGIIIQYFTTDDDNATGIRNGGFGSTTK